MEPNRPNMEPMEEGKYEFSDSESREGAEVNHESSIQEKEISKENISAENEDSYSKILAKVKDSNGGDSNDSGIANDAQDASKEMDADSQVSKLVEIAMDKGVLHAVKVAKHMDDNYVLDAFHDKLLADELHEALTKKGLIRDI